MLDYKINVWTLYLIYVNSSISLKKRHFTQACISKINTITHGLAQSYSLKSKGNHEEKGGNLK